MSAASGVQVWVLYVFRIRWHIGEKADRPTAIQENRCSPPETVSTEDHCRSLAPSLGITAACYAFFSFLFVKPDMSSNSLRCHATLELTRQSKGS